MVISQNDIDAMKNNFIEDYVFYIKAHEKNRVSTNERNAFWRKYMKENKNEN